MPGASLKDNMQALKEHYAHAQKIGHNTAKLYAEWRTTGRSGEYDDYDNDGIRGGGKNVYDPYSGDEIYSDDPAGAKAEGQRITDEAIAMAEAGDVVPSLALFQKAVDLDPQNTKHYENLGVTQMRWNYIYKTLVLNSKIIFISRRQCYLFVCMFEGLVC